MNEYVILFDGVCNLCNSFVQFVIERDKAAKFKFASLQSAYAKEKLQGSGINDGEINTVVLVYNNQVYTKSTAALKIVKEFGGFWTLFYPLIYVPKFLRDAIYNFIAKNRYKWFGKKESCMVPSPNLKSRFLD